MQDPQAKITDKLVELGMPVTHDDLEYIEHRVYHDYVGTVDYGLKDPNLNPDGPNASNLPYEQDLSQYPEIFKKYQENYEKYDAVENRFANEDPLEEQAEGPFVKKMPKDMSPWEKKYDLLMPRYTGTSC